MKQIFADDTSDVNFRRYRTIGGTREYKEEQAERGHDISSANFSRPIAVAITIIAASVGLISRWNPVQSLFYPI